MNANFIANKNGSACLPQAATVTASTWAVNLTGPCWWARVNDELVKWLVDELVDDMVDGLVMVHDGT